MKNVPGFILVTCIVSISFFVSLFTLFNQSIRLDEAQSIWEYTKSIPTLLTLTAQDVLVPLYGLLLHFWLQLFGTSEIASRSLSMVFFLISVPVLYKLAKEASNQKIAYMTIILFSFSPFIMWYTNEARMYTLFFLVVTLNNLFFLRLFKSDGKNGKMGFFLSSLLGFYTHYFFFFLMLTQGIFVLGKLTGVIRSINDFNDVPHLSNFSRYKTFAALFFLVEFAAFIFFVPWLVYVFKEASIFNTLPFIPSPSAFNIFQVFVQFIFGFQTSTIQGILISLWPLLILLIVVSFTQKKQVTIFNFEYFILVTILPVLMMFFFSFIRPIFLARYLILVTPTLFFILAVFLLSFSKRMTYVFASFFIACMFLLLLNQNVSASTPLKENYKDLATYLNTHTKPQDIIDVTSPFTIYPVEYYYLGKSKIETIPQWDHFAHGPIPSFSEASFEKQIKNESKTYNLLYLVLSYDQGYQQTIIAYMDSHYLLKEKQSFTPGMQIRVYQLRYDNE